MSNWVTSKKTQDAFLNPQYLAIQLVVRFAGLAFEWWRWLPSETNEDLLHAGDVDQQILKALVAQFYGTKKDKDNEHSGYMFLT